MSLSISSKDMKALVDAVATVTSQPAFHRTNLVASSNCVRMSVSTLAQGTSNNGTAPMRKRKHCDVPALTESLLSKNNPKEFVEARTKRLEQNRLAAIECRRRKKVMVEELKRSVQFYSKTNASLKSRNEELQRQIILAKQKVIAIEENAKSEGTETGSSVKNDADTHLEKKTISSIWTKLEGPPKFRKSDNVGDHSSPLNSSSTRGDAEQAQKAQFATTQALYKIMGFPPTAEQAAASTSSLDIGQTVMTPGMSDVECSHSKTNVTGAISSLRLAKAASKNMLSEKHRDEKSLEKVAVDETSMAYIEALNRVSFV